MSENLPCTKGNEATVKRFVVKFYYKYIWLMPSPRLYMTPKLWHAEINFARYSIDSANMGRVWGHAVVQLAH